MLDWILVSHPGRIVQSGVLPDSFSDHSMIFCIWKIKVPHLPPKMIKVRQFNKINPEHFTQDILNINWERFKLIPSVEDAWNLFYTEEQACSFEINYGQGSTSTLDQGRSHTLIQAKRQGLEKIP